eukprot:scaffold4001_cov94-Cylindrotheca_fusiformis.AAC.10
MATTNNISSISATTTNNKMTAMKIPCCLCGTLIFPNNANQCATCLAQNFDLKSELERGPGNAPHPTIYQCRKCRRYQRTPTLYEACEPESPELLSICLKHLPALNNSNKYKVKEASWIWTEPHSMRFKIKLSVQTLVENVLVQQRVMVELHCAWQQCPDCNREYTSRTWTAIVQLRQRRRRNDQGQQKGLFTLEQALRSNASIRKHVLSIDASREGLDFYFQNVPQAQMFSNYLRKVAPMKISTSTKLVSTDSHNNTAHRKHNITCEMVPLCVQDLVVVDKMTCKNNKLAGQLILILKVKSVVHAISASPPRLNIGDSLVEISPDSYYKYEKSYRILQSSNRLVRFVVLDVELCETTTTETRPPDTYYYDDEDDDKDDKKKKKKYNTNNNNNNNSSSYYALADVQVVRENDMASNDVLCCVSHLGHVLQAGDIVLGYDLSASTFMYEADWGVNLNHQFVLPDVVLVKKVTVSKKGNNKKEDSILDDETDHQSSNTRLDSKPKLSKKKQRRRRRKENKKMKDLEERVERMGFLEEENDNDFDEDELEEDPEMAEQLQALEDDFAKLDKEQQQQQKKDQSRGQKEQQQQEQEVDDEEENDDKDQCRQKQHEQKEDEGENDNDDDDSQR